MMTSGGYLKGREESFRGEREIKTEAPQGEEERRRRKEEEDCFFTS
jgi:hypothetical protein